MRCHRLGALPELIARACFASHALLRSPSDAFVNVGQWLEHMASRVERKNFVKLMRLLGEFEQQSGLQQSGPARGGAEGTSHAIVIPLGAKLRCGITFFVDQ